jgi:PAS domain S-box-containing protein
MMASIRLSDLVRLMLSFSLALCLTDVQGRLVLVNSGWVEVTGYNLREVEGSTCKILHGMT